MSSITKAIIPVAGRGTRFLPLSKVVAKELFPLGTKPLLHHAVAEAKLAGATEIIFVANSSKKAIEEYLGRSLVLEKFLEEKKNEKMLEELHSVEKLCQGLTFIFVAEPKPLGDGHAVLQAKKAVGDEPCYVMYPDDVFLTQKPVLSQLEQRYKTSQRPMIALSRLPAEKISSYGVIEGEKITNRVYKIRKIVEKPQPEHAPSNLAVVGRSVITSEVFDYLKRAVPNKKGEISLTETFAAMAQDGQVLYGYEIEGKWLECGNKQEWLKSFIWYTLSDPETGKDLKRFLREEKLI